MRKLAVAREEVEIEVTDVAAGRRIGNRPLRDVGIPDVGDVALGKRHAEQLGIDVEHRMLDVFDGKVLRDRMVVDRIPRLIQHFIVIDDVPRIERSRRNSQVLGFERRKRCDVDLCAR